MWAAICAVGGGESRRIPPPDTVLMARNGMPCTPAGAKPAKKYGGKVRLTNRASRCQSAGHPPGRAYVRMYWPSVALRPLLWRKGIIFPLLGNNLQTSVRVNGGACPPYERPGHRALCLSGMHLGCVLPGRVGRRATHMP